MNNEQRRAVKDAFVCMLAIRETYGAVDPGIAKVVDESIDLLSAAFPEIGELQSALKDRIQNQLAKGQME